MRGDRRWRCGGDFGVGGSEEMKWGVELVLPKNLLNRFNSQLNRFCKKSTQIPKAR